MFTFLRNIPVGSIRLVAILAGIFIYLSFSVKAQTQKTIPPDTVEPKGLVKWLDIETAIEENKKHPKPILIDFYTDWCGWCKHMMRTTFSNEGLAAYINQNFYPVRFNAETRDTIYYMGEKLFNAGTHKKSTHQFAVKMLGERISYPTLVLLNNNFQFKLLVPGYQDVQKLEPILVYTLENVYMSTAVEDFRSDFEKLYARLFKPETINYDTITRIKWLGLQQGINSNVSKPKKLMIFAYTQWCNSCQVMKKVVFNDTAISNYINKHFYPVDFNIEMNDSVVFSGNVFKKYPGSFHQFALALMQNKIIIPSIYFLDEENRIIAPVPYFNNSKSLKPILKYIAEEHYKTTKWDDYIKEYREKGN